MVSVVVDDPDLSPLSLELEAAAYASEVLHGTCCGQCVVAEPARDPGGGQRVEHVVPPEDAELDRAAALAALREHVAVRAEDLRPQVPGREAVGRGRAGCVGDEPGEGRV